MSHLIKQLDAADAAAFQTLRLLGLQQHACEFGAAFDEEAGRTLDEVGAMLGRSTVFGGVAADGTTLLGVAGFQRQPGAKKCHKGVLWGVYVAPAGRGAGLGTALVERVIVHAAGQVEQLHATVALANMPARRIYQRLGFQAYGIEPRGLKAGERYFDQELLVLPL